MCSLKKTHLKRAIYTPTKTNYQLIKRSFLKGNCFFRWGTHFSFSYNDLLKWIHFISNLALTQSNKKTKEQTINLRYCYLLTGWCNCLSCTNDKLQSNRPRKLSQTSWIVKTEPEKFSLASVNVEHAWPDCELL